MGKAKGGSIFIRLVSAAGTGFFYVKRKNPRKVTEKLEFLWQWLLLGIFGLPFVLDTSDETVGAKYLDSSEDGSSPDSVWPPGLSYMTTNVARDS
ncbi:hypothetical protein HHK36_020700 [Tetracentron sinense]|uniref:Uncharacterized protein n=1 Tax=Tetracentron sinense TaxID=13715 RepID=A0A834YZG1_TETSI|nr:hypothetical protein HHK36_020700 [Tetracentron sinense]